MANGEELLSYFQKEIKKAADKELEILNEKAKLISESSTKKMQSKAKSDALELERKKVAELEEQYAKKTMALKSDFTKKRFKRRNELQDELFNECKEKLLLLVDSNKYTLYMQKHLTMLSAFEKNDQLVIEVAKRDLEYAQLFLKQYPNAKIAINEDIEIGGFIVINYTKGTVYDCTIDDALKKQKEWFINHSKLTIR